MEEVLHQVFPKRQRQGGQAVGEEQAQYGRYDDQLDPGQQEDEAQFRRVHAHGVEDGELPSPVLDRHDDRHAHADDRQAGDGRHAGVGGNPDPVDERQRRRVRVHPGLHIVESPGRPDPPGDLLRVHAVLQRHVDDCAAVLRPRQLLDELAAGIEEVPAAGLADVKRAVRDDPGDPAGDRCLSGEAGVGDPELMGEVTCVRGGRAT